jgi:purine nucleoside phosphorylase
MTMQRVSPLRLERERAREKFEGLAYGAIPAAAIISESFHPVAPQPEPWLATIERYAGADVLCIVASRGCPSLARAGCVAALAELGVKALFLLGEGMPIEPIHGSSTIIAVEDHINFLGDNPLIGPHDPSLGPRFPEMSEAYSKKLLRNAKPFLRHGYCTYAACPFESLGNSKYCQRLLSFDAQLGGPWIVPEVLAARQAAMETLAFVVPSRANYRPREGASRESESIYREFKEITAHVLESIRA